MTENKLPILSSIVSGVFGLLPLYMTYDLTMKTYDYSSEVASNITSSEIVSNAVEYGLPYLTMIMVSSYTAPAIGVLYHALSEIENEHRKNS